MKHYLFCTVLCVFALNTSQAQQSQESVQALSPKAVKGYVYGINKADNGDLNITYKIAGDNKQDVFFETYAFNKQLQFINSNNTSVPKEDKEDRVQTYFYASVGGCSSFDILSMKLKLHKRILQQSWSHEKQKYITTKVVSDENIKAKNDNGKAYKGFASYTSSTDANGTFIIAANDKTEKKQVNPFFILQVSPDLDISEKTIDVAGNQSLVYCDQLSNDDVVMVFAPKKGQGDPSNYTYLRYSIKGDLISKVPFTSPSNNLLIMDAREQNGAVYFCGTSTKSKDSYDEVFEDYASIVNPCFKDELSDQDFKWQKKSDQKMESFHLLKFKDDKLIFASTSPVADFKSKFKASGKGASAYKGNKFSISKFFVTADDEFLIAGQLTSRAVLGSGYGALGNTPQGTVMKTYQDIICLHFDKAGQLKAQYGVERLNDDKKSEIFSIEQNFYLGSDKKTLYWELLEAKGKKGYAGFMDAMNGNLTYYPLYSPRIAKIDLANTNVGEFEVLGNKKFYLRKDFTGLFSDKENSITYVGHDEDYKKLWVGKFNF